MSLILLFVRTEKISLQKGKCCLTVNKYKLSPVTISSVSLTTHVQYMSNPHFLFTNREHLSYGPHISFSSQAPVVQRLDNAIHRINPYPVDKC